MIRTAALSLLLAVLTACAPERGTVTSRGYEDPYVDYVTLCTPAGSTQVCMPYPSHIPECWKITFADGDRENSVCVGRSTWDSIHVGDHFDINQTDTAT